jgi:hypothetical protein
MAAVVRVRSSHPRGSDTGVSYEICLPFKGTEKLSGQYLGLICHE